MHYDATRAGRGLKGDKRRSLLVALRVGNIMLDCDDMLSVARFRSAELTVR
jgi:hypothetical protein